MVAGIGLLVFMSGCASQTDSIGTEEETAIFEDSVQNDNITTEEDMDMTEKIDETRDESTLLPTEPGYNFFAGYLRGAGRAENHYISTKEIEILVRMYLDAAS